MGIKRITYFFLVLMIVPSARADDVLKKIPQKSDVVVAIEQGNAELLATYLKDGLDITDYVGPDQESLLAYAITKLAQDSYDQESRTLLILKTGASFGGMLGAVVLMAKPYYPLIKKIFSPTLRLVMIRDSFFTWIGECKKAPGATALASLKYVGGGLLLAGIAHQCLKASIACYRKWYRIMRHHRKIEDRVEIIALLIDHPSTTKYQLEEALTTIGDLHNATYDTQLMWNIQVRLSTRLITLTIPGDTSSTCSEL